MTTSSQTCKICKASNHFFGTAIILKRYPVKYYRCTECGFIQTEEPYWLDEAYSSAITNSDVGLVQRNMMLAPTVSLIIQALFDTSGKFVDYGGGYGLFVRLMRDRGLNYFWHDPYCENLFARYFEADLSAKHCYDLLTAFEVMEHLVDPWGDLQKMEHLAPSLLFMTNLVPDPAPPLDEWWYYGLEHGQHVALYTVESLRRLGQRLGLHLYTNGGTLHLLTPKRLNPLVFRLATSGRVVRLWNMVSPKRSLTQADYEQITGRVLNG